MLLDLLRKLQRFRAPFSLHHALVGAARAGVLVGRGIGAVFAGQHAARQRAIGYDAEARGITAGQFAVSWVLNSSFVSAVIAGPRTEEQWDDYLKALDYRFTAEDEALIDRLVVSGHPSTPGFNDPGYPIEGRRARTADQTR